MQTTLVEAEAMLIKKRKHSPSPVRAASHLESDEELARRLHEQLNGGFTKIISTRRTVKAHEAPSTYIFDAAEPPRRKLKAEHRQDSAPCSPSDDKLARKKSSFCRELHSLLTDVDTGSRLGKQRSNASAQADATAVATNGMEADTPDSGNNAEAGSDAKALLQVVKAEADSTSHNNEHDGEDGAVQQHAQPQEDAAGSSGQDAHALQLKQQQCPRATPTRPPQQHKHMQSETAGGSSSSHHHDSAASAGNQQQPARQAVSSKSEEHRPGSSQHATSQGAAKPAAEAHSQPRGRGGGPGKIPKLPMVKHGKEWYRARVVKDAGSKVLLEFAGLLIEPHPFWLPRDSDRIWRGSYKGKDWKYLGDGAWEPKVKGGKKRRPAKAATLKKRAQKASKVAASEPDSDSEGEKDEDEEEPQQEQQQEPEEQQQVEEEEEQKVQEAEPVARRSSLRRQQQEQQQQEASADEAQPMDEDCPADVKQEQVEDMGLHAASLLLAAAADQAKQEQPNSPARFASKAASQRSPGIALRPRAAPEPPKPKESEEEAPASLARQGSREMKMQRNDSSANGSGSGQSGQLARPTSPRANRRKGKPMRARLDSEEEMVSAGSSREAPRKQAAKVVPLVPPPVALPAAPSQPGSPPAGDVEQQAGSSKMTPRSLMEAEGHLGWKGAWKGAWKKARQADTSMAAATAAAAPGAAADEDNCADAQDRHATRFSERRAEAQHRQEATAAAPAAGMERRSRNGSMDDAQQQEQQARRSSSSAAPSRQPGQSAAAAAAIAALEEIKAAGVMRHAHPASSSLPPLPPRHQQGSPTAPSRTSSLQQSSNSEPNLKVIRNGKKRTNAAPRCASHFTPARMPWLAPDSPEEPEQQQAAAAPRFRPRPGPQLQAGSGHHLRSSSPTARDRPDRTPKSYHNHSTPAGSRHTQDVRAIGPAKEQRPLLYNSRNGALQNLLQAVGELQNSRWLPQQLASRAAMAAALGSPAPRQPAAANGHCRQASLVMSLLLANLPSLEQLQQHVPVALESGSRLPGQMPKPPVPLFKDDA